MGLFDVFKSNLTDAEYDNLSFDELLRRAKRGDANAQNRVGVCYNDGKGVAQNYAEAARWYQKAAAQGHLWGCRNLGLLYDEGQGVPQDYAAAARCYRSAAEGGLADAQNRLGNLYYWGHGVPKDHVQAVEWYQKAAAQGYAEGQRNLGIMYENGWGVSQDYANAAEWLRKAADQGHADAQHELGWLYQNGSGVPQDYARAMEWYQKAAAQGHAAAQNNVGWLYQNGWGAPQDYASAMEWYQKAAAQGHASAQNNIGFLYDNGWGVPQDYARAMEWYQKAAAQGNVAAQNNIGVLYNDGLGVPQDYAKAAQWYKKAADQGNLWGMNNLGKLYRDGLGVAQDGAKARELFSKAAAQGHEGAQAELAAMDNPPPVAQPTEQSAAPQTSLDELVGLQSVKDELHEIESSIGFERGRARQLGVSDLTGQKRYNFIFSGNPGTGKTTVARLLADILHRAGAIRENRLVEADRSKLVSKWVGDTAIKTTEVVESALGGVLFIDEAYALVQGDQDNVGREALDTLVKLIEEHKYDLSVILAGYAKDIAELLGQNQGLQSRFNKTLDFPDYSPDELLEIARRIAGKWHYNLSEGGERAFREVIAKERVKPGFANARTVDSLMQEAMERHAVNAGKHAADPSYLTTLTETDFGVDFSERGGSGLEGLRRQLDELIGLGGVKAAVRRQVAKLDFMRREEEKAGRPLGLGKERLHLCFTGNPGTGKTTVARLYAGILRELGFLARGHLEEVGRGDLVGRYQGNTAEKTRKACESAYGGILFVDEAYGLCTGEGDAFGREAINELITQMENNRDRLVVILAGYSREMEEFFGVNSGIKSRISQIIEFADYNAEELWRIFQLTMKKHEPPLSADDAASRLIQEKIRAMHERRDAKFGNAREMEKLFNAIRDNMIVRVSEGGLDGEARYTITREDVEAA